MAYHRVFGEITSILKKDKCWLEVFEHEEVRTSEEAAKVRIGYSLHQGAKALVLRVKSKEGKRFVMAVIPGDARLDNKKVKRVMESKDVRFATEEEVSEITDGVKLGGVPPFGNLFGLEVYVDPEVLINEKIVFNAGDRRVSVGMRSEDYRKLTNPEVVNIQQR